MEMGMLWYDDDKKRSLEEKIRRAADYYQHKFGHAPTLCVINPRLLGKGMIKIVKAVTLRTAQNVPIHHFWIGLSEETAGQEITAQDNTSIR